MTDNKVTKNASGFVDYPNDYPNEISLLESSTFEPDYIWFDAEERRKFWNPPDQLFEYLIERIEYTESPIKLKNINK